LRFAFRARPGDRGAARRHVASSICWAKRAVPKAHPPLVAARSASTKSLSSAPRNSKKSYSDPDFFLFCRASWSALICTWVLRYRRNPFLRHRHVFAICRDELDLHLNMEFERRTEMTSTVKKAIPLAVGLVLLAGSPAFAARHHLNKETRIHDLIAPTYASVGSVVSSADASYCAQRWAYYDPASGKYMGDDGDWRPCP
jgi:hypothetical protein